jgi:ATP-dependent Clp protease protease subunit
MNRFWNFTSEDTGERTLRLDGAISDETWWGDEVTPAAFRAELASGKGNVTVWINSPGGDVFAAAQIYNALKEYPGKVTVKVDGLAASAASVVAMAGEETLMSPVSYMVIHNPATIAIGDGEEMLRAKAMLDEIKEGIINAYESKTGLPRAEISRMMNEESCFNAKKAVDLGFADRILYADGSTENASAPVIFSRMAVVNSLMTKMSGAPKISAPVIPVKPIKSGTAYNILENRVNELAKR